jgi:hypothetical protein
MGIIELVPFSVLGRLRDALTRSEVADPKVVARQVAQEVPDEHLRDALATALAALAPAVEARRRSSIRQQSERSTESDSSYLPAFVKEPPVGSSERRTVTQPRRSRWKETSLNYRDYRTKLLASRVATKTGSKLLRDCTTEDVLYAAQIRYDQADKLSLQADWYLHLADIMKRHNAEIVADLKYPDFPKAAITRA